MQSGFRPGYSTQDVLTYVTDSWRKSIENKEFVGCVFLDLTKAFDCIDHHILLNKLSSYNFGANTLDRFRSYLSERHQYVCVNSQSSELGEGKFGVPQGSILGPLLFSLFINDLPTILRSCHISLYADDAVIFLSHSSLDVLNETIQEEMANIGRWMLSNKLKLNLKKSVTMLIGSPQKIKDLSLNISVLGESLINVIKIKYLGVIVDNHLKWVDHINYLKQCISLKIACLRRLLPLPKPTILFLYKSYILSILDYCDCVWSSASTSLLKSLDDIHYRFLKLVDRKNISPLSPSLCLSSRRQFHVSILSYKVLNGYCPEYLTGLVKFSSEVTGRSSRNQWWWRFGVVVEVWGGLGWWWRYGVVWGGGGGLGWRKICCGVVVEVWDGLK